MESGRVFLVILLAITFTGASNPPTKSIFPDFLAPLRGIFKSIKPNQPHSEQHSEQQQKSSHSGQQNQHSMHSAQPVRFRQFSKDLSGAETGKYSGQYKNPGDNGGFRPYFPSEFEDSPSSLGRESSSSSRPYNQLPEQYNRPHPTSSNRIPRQEPGQGSQGFDFQNFGNLGDELQEQRGGGPSGFTDFGYGTPEFGQSYEQPQHQVRGPPRSQRRPIIGDSNSPHNSPHNSPQGNEPESQGFGPGSYSRPQTDRPPRRPFRGPRPDPEYETQLLGPQHRSPYHSAPSANYPSNSFPGSYEQGPRDTHGEPQIITLDDLQKENIIPGASPPYFDEVYQQPQMQFGSRPSKSHTRHIPTFSTLSNGESSRNPIYESHPLPTSAGRFQNFNSNPNPGIASDEMFQESKPGKQFAHRPVRRPSSMNSKPTGSTTLQPDVQYGRPLVMSASTLPAASTKAQQKVKPYSKKYSGSPILLSSPQIPNFMNSASISNPVIQPYEPHMSASDHGHSHGGDFGGIQSNGDRILYHVAGHEGPYSYRFGFDTGKGYNRLFRFEEKDGKGYVKGKYGFYDKHGKINVVNYQAHPQNGFSAQRGH